MFRNKAERLTIALFIALAVTFCASLGLFLFWFPMFVLAQVAGASMIGMFVTVGAAALIAD